MPASPQLDPAVLEILRCPVTGSRLTQEGSELVTVDDPARRYPIDQGVPKLLPNG
ncbi:hypothetical protein HGQ17_02755 [Nesterenkonia sp. MY13]|uniref:Trm112 family protein n=1 Tax=Nesterenkonia sedimenti TaxID=1463632 RepID=A0A7X8TIZ7_9MICC|nr:Trm112 family protein [Nesterenkonia sedimenti]NLS08938.1 hypothetical protein [Nesterenkonia sedimenti]